MFTQVSEYQNPLTNGAKSATYILCTFCQTVQLQFGRENAVKLTSSIDVCESTRGMHLNDGNSYLQRPRHESKTEEDEEEEMVVVD